MIRRALEAVRFLARIVIASPVTMGVTTTGILFLFGALRLLLPALSIGRSIAATIAAAIGVALLTVPVVARMLVLEDAARGGGRPCTRGNPPC